MIRKIYATVFSPPVWRNKPGRVYINVSAASYKNETENEKFATIKYRKGKPTHE